MGLKDTLFGKDPAKEQKKWIAKSLNQLYLAQQAQKPLFAEARRGILQQIASTKGGFADAQKQLALTGAAQRGNAIAAGEVAGAQQRQQLISSGLNTTVGSNRVAQYGRYGSVTQRAIAAIDAALAGQQAELSAQGGAAVGQGYGNLAELLMGQSAQQSDLFKNKAAILGNVQVAGGGGLLNTFANLAKTGASIAALG